jgi:hypothetical protein
MNTDKIRKADDEIRKRYISAQMQRTKDSVIWFDENGRIAYMLEDGKLRFLRR